MKKYNGTAWVDTTLRQYKTATDTLTTLPADIYADGTNATVGLQGNMSQSGTPTPTTPIQPQECGDLETEGAKAGQYKIPISSGGTSTNVYLGEVESTRKIQKSVLTGEENFYKNSASSTNYLYYAQKGSILPSSINKPPVICNELPVTSDAPQTVIGISTNNTFGVIYFNFGADVMNAQPSGNTDAGLKEYLAAQYANGTPVTVWYVLATETTGIVNEPIRKIGDYADTVSGITIPTITGKDAFDVLTSLKPSEVSLAYTGWHDASVKEWDGSEWQ